MIDFKFVPVNEPTIAAVKAVIPFYEKMLLEVLAAILDRYERDCGYPFIDMKLDIITGKDFYPVSRAEDAFKGKEVIYSWIQGRGLEALAGHAAWLPECSIIGGAEKALLISRIRKVLSEVIASMEKCRAVNHGRLFFCLSPAGDVLQVKDYTTLVPGGKIPPPGNYSDLFYAKGLLAAAAYLQMEDKEREAAEYLRRVTDDIMNDNFCSDQQAFDPKNRVVPQPGKKIQGPWMIALSGIAAAAELEDRGFWLDRAEKFISHILNRHVNTGQYDFPERYDFWEAVDEAGAPWREPDGGIICDPGHSLEFVGLSLKSLLQVPSGAQSLRCRAFYPDLLKHNFELGFNPAAGGICKAFDLSARRSVNTDMPWWSLPETIRAASEVIAFCGCSEDMLKIITACTNAFLGNYLNPAAHFMAYQTRDISGNPVNVIPATPDADPGYHTGLSIIDFIRIFNRL